MWQSLQHNALVCVWALNAELSALNLGSITYHWMTLGKMLPYLLQNGDYNKIPFSYIL